MNSSFLTGLHIALALMVLGLFLKLFIQLGRSKNPTLFIIYVVGISCCCYFVGQALTDLNLLSPWSWMKWRGPPLLAIGFSLFVQAMLLGRGLGEIALKVASRVPIIGALLVYSLSIQWIDYWVSGLVLAGGVFLIIFVRKSRYQKRIYFKMTFLFLIYLALITINTYSAYIIGEILVFFIIFYLYLFEHSFSVGLLVNDLRLRKEEDSQ